MTSPKPQRRFLRTRHQAFYRFLYLLAVGGASYCVYRSLQVPPQLLGPGLGPGPHALITVPVPASSLPEDAAASAPPPSDMFMFEYAARQLVDDMAGLSPRELKWAEKPSSLCYGCGGYCNVTIVTVALGLPKEYVVNMRRNRLSYAAQHGYRYCEVGQRLDFSRPPAWTKVLAVLLVLSFSDVVVHMDADALVLNKTIGFHSILGMDSYNASAKDVVYTTDFQPGRDAEPDEKDLLNTGVYIIRSTPWAKDFLETQYQFRSSIYHKFWEQDAVMLFRMKNTQEFYEHVALIPFRYMNVPCSIKYNYLVPGDFVAHYAGGHNLEKYERLAAMFFPFYNETTFKPPPSNSISSAGQRAFGQRLRRRQLSHS